MTSVPAAKAFAGICTRTELSAPPETVASTAVSARIFQVSTRDLSAGRVPSKES